MEKHQNVKIAYSGIPGCFAYMAALRIFPGAELISFNNFAKAYKAVENDECDKAVLPIENSYAGEVAPVMDLMYQGSLSIEGVYELEIEQCLMGIKGSKETDIESVMSHPQALSQCEKYLSLRNMKSIQCENTAIAAFNVSKKVDALIGAIGSIEAAKLYGLDILKRGINDSKDNVTKFTVLRKHMTEDIKFIKNENEKNEAFILMFTVDNLAGALAKAIAVIGDYGFNMSAIRSRPRKDINWQYYFYVEAKGKIDSSRGKAMLGRLRNLCLEVKLLGKFYTDIRLVE